MYLKKIPPSRWKLAQESEEGFWKRYKTSELSHEKYKKKTKILIKKWEQYIPINKKTKILQIGCGPLDLINFLGDMEKYSLDPLADFYKNRFDVDYKESHLIKGVGEKIPFNNNFFDIVLLPNVLDHTLDPKKVLSEIHRVLKDDGILYFDVYFYQKNFLRLAKIWGILKKTIKKQTFNPAHPYMFTLDEVKKIISHDFKIIFEEVGRDIGEYDNLNELKIRRNNQKITKKLPANIGLLGEINYTAICKKKSK